MTVVAIANSAKCIIHSRRRKLHPDTKFSRLSNASMTNGSAFNKKYFVAFWIGHLVGLMILAGTEAQKRDLADPVGRFRGSSGRIFNFNFANICSGR